MRNEFNHLHMNLIILHSDSMNTRLLSKEDKGKWELISFLDEETTEKILRKLSPLGIYPEVSFGLKKMHEFAKSERDSYVKFISDWSKKSLKNGKSFLEYSVIDGNFPLWWISFPFHKDTEESPTYTWFCQGKVLSKLLASKKYEKIFLITEHNSALGFFEGIIQHIGIRHYLNCTLKNKKVKFNFFIKHRVKGFLREVRAWYKSYSLASEPTSEKYQADIAWLSLFPCGWSVGKDPLEDRYYKELPHLLKKELIITQDFIGWYSHENYSFRKIKSSFDHFQSKGYRHRFLQNKLSLIDYIREYFNFNRIFKFLLIFSSAEFKKSFEHSNLNLYPLLKEEFIHGFLNGEIEKNILARKAAAHYSEERQPKIFISFLESYPISKAILDGICSKNVNVKTVAHQHACYNSMKLWLAWTPEDQIKWDENNQLKSLPVFDYYLCQGKLFRNLLLKNGLPPSRCILTGSHRYDHFFSLNNEKKVKTFQKINILVASTYEKIDAKALILTTFKGCHDLSNVNIILRPHPNLPLEPIMNELAIKGVSFTYSQEPIRDAILNADIIITTYSSVADEAIVMGKKVIIILHQNRVCLSTFFDLPHFNRFAFTGKELRVKLLETISQLTKDDSRLSEESLQILEASFFSQDSNNSKRIIEFLTKLLNLNRLS